MRFPFCRNRDSVKNGILISIRRTGDGFHPGLFIATIKYSDVMETRLCYMCDRCCVYAQLLIVKISVCVIIKERYIRNYIMAQLSRQKFNIFIMN